MKKKILSLLACLSIGMSAQAQSEGPLWMRGGAISPDGSSIAFSYMGNIYVVSSKGGEAKQLTTNESYDANPHWSPDGSQLAFASNREGSLDVYTMSAQGGLAKRITTHSQNEYPAGWLNNDTLLIRRAGNPTVDEITFPSSTFTRLYKVGKDGGRQVLFSAISMDHVSIASDGRILYNNVKGYEDTWRKHQTSSIARDIYMKEGNAYKRMTTFAGEDRNPIWKPSGNGYYYLSEQDGTFNVYEASLSGDSKQLTSFKGNPVRYLSMSNGGTLAFAYDGEIYTLTPGQEPKRVDIRINTDIDPDQVVRTLVSRGATNVAVSPKGKDVAFVLNGDVYVTTMDFSTTKQITQTPERERRIDFRADGRAVLYDSERGGIWSLYETEMTNDKEQVMTYCTELRERRLTDGVTTSFQPQYSPDGKKVAFLQNRDAICVMDLKSGKIRTVRDGKYAYSYSDGDQYFAWSPDSKWLLSNYQGNGGWNNEDVALLDAEGKKEPVNLTQSGYSDGRARWVMGGKAMIFASDRAGYRSHGSWGAESDVYITFFDDEAYHKFRLNKEDRALLEEAEKDKKSEKKDSADKEKKVDELKLQLDNLDDRTMRLTMQSSRLADAVMNNEGTRLYYLAPHNGSMALWIRDFLEERTELKMQRIDAHSLKMDKSGTSCYFIGQGGTLCKLDLNSASIKTIPFEAFTVNQPAKTQEYNFEHIWRQTKEKLYDPNMNGADWDRLYTTYKRYLPHINNGYDFAEMASELLGELNVSHTGCRYHASSSRLPVAELGLLFDETYQGEGLKVAEVLSGGPLDTNDKVKAGTIILAIDGEAITSSTDHYPMLAGKAGKATRLTLKGEKKEITVRPISSGRQNQLLYKRWVRRNEQMVDKLSNGRIAYVHIEAMNAASFHEFYKNLLSEKNRTRDAVIVDTRHNGGGWLHNDVCIALSGKAYSRYTPRGKFIGNDPFDRWVKPSCMLVCEDNYSNAHGTPWLYKEMGIGKLIGAPVPGTMTAVWWENIGQYTFGIPQVGTRDNRDNYLENQELQPDIECYITPENMLRGIDTQIQTAVEELLKK